METQFKLPKLSETGAKGTVARVLVGVGDTVAEDQPVLEVETDKAVVEVPSSVSGKVTSVHVSEGDEIGEGTAIFSLEAADGESAAAELEVKPEADAPRTADAAQTVAATVAADEAPSRPAAAPPPPPANGAAPSSAEPAAARKPPSPPAAPAAPVAAPAGADPSGALVPAAPSVRRLARELGVAIGEVPGNGPSGRISVDDVKAFVRQARAEVAAMPAGRGLPSALPDFAQWGEIERKPLSGIRRATAEHLSEAWTAPHVTQFDKADITELEKLRKRYGPRAEAKGGKLTMTAILLKVTAAALRAFPQFNTSIDMRSGELIYKKYTHIGVAVDTEHGLLVPVIRDVDRKSMTGLAVELGEIAAKARERKLGLADMQGGCFTLSNLGGIGGTGFTPVVNSPEVAILGVARGRMEPVYDKETGEFQPRLLLPLALSYDHRVIDGADGIRFLRWIVEVLEDPFLLSLEG